jgi:hypothetical protein
MCRRRYQRCRLFRSDVRTTERTILQGAVALVPTIRGLKRVSCEGAPVAIFLMLLPPTSTDGAEAVSAGFWEFEGRRHPCL